MPSPNAEARLESNDFDTSALQIHRVLGREAISQLYRFEIDFVSLEGAPLALRDLAGAQASLVFEVEGEEARTVHGMIAEATDMLTSEPGYRSYRIVLVPRMHRLALVETHDVFLRTSVPAILTQKLELFGLGGDDVETRLSDTYPEREIVVEYKETDLAFVSRLAEHLGISFFFLNDDGRDRVVFTDQDVGFGALPEDGKVPFYGRGEHAGVYALEETARVMPETFTVIDYSYATPLLDVSGSHTSPVGFAGGVVEYAPNAPTPGECAKLAEIRAQERAALHNFFQGESTRVAFRAGLRFTLEGHSALDGDKDLLLVEVTHHFSQPVALHGAPGESSYHNTFRAVAGSAYRPPRLTPKPRIFGLLTAVVEPGPEVVGKHADIDEVGRYTVRFRFDTTPPGERPKSSLPVRMLQPHAGTGYGMHFPLHPGVEVAIAFEDGDPDRPLIVGAVPNAVTTSPVTAANSGMSRIQTASGIRVTLRDHLERRPDVPKFLTTGATLQCTMGAAPSVFTAQGLPGVPQILGSLPAATIAEFTPTNILTFGMCKSPSNPTVVSATAAAMGTLTPMPCVPNVVAPWAPPSTCVTVNGLALATAQSKCACAYGGTISVQAPTQGPEDTK